MAMLRKIDNTPIEGFVIDPNNPIRDGLALMIKNGWAYPNAEGDNVLRDAEGNIEIAGPEWWADKIKYLEDKCAPFLNHLKLIMSRDPRDVDVFLDYMAFKQQYAGVKPRWALVLAGEQGVGKDVSIEACWEEYGVNFINNVSPSDIMSPYNDYVQCMLLRISEAADLLEGNRWTFNERLKVLIAGHPDNMLINRKYGFKYWCTLYCGVILTTNHLQGGLYIPKGDRRMYVINCATMQEIGLNKIADREAYFERLFKWFRTPDEDGYTGYQYIGNYLFWGRNVEHFNASICPEPTQAKINAMQDSDGVPDWLDNALTAYQTMIEQRKDRYLSGDLEPVFKAEREFLIAPTDEGLPRVFSWRRVKELAAENGDRSEVKLSDNYLRRLGYEKLRYKGNKSGNWRLRVAGQQCKETFYIFTKIPKIADKYYNALFNSFDDYYTSFIGGATDGF